jgi:hypothetical protein
MHRIGRLVLALLGFLVCVGNARAEPCELLGGCLGNIWYMHVPKSQLQGRSVFRAAGVPNVNAQVVVAEKVSLLRGPAFVHPPYPEELKRDLHAAVQRGEALSGWGSVLREGSRVKILSYRTFPELENVGDELFALVLVLSE